MSTARDKASVRKGEVIGGKYRVERVLGAGGMGMVVAAVHVDLGTAVAVKVLLPHMMGDEAIARFHREARAVVQLRGEHVAKVLDVGRLKTGAPFLVMELLVGDDLDRVVTDRGPLPVAEAVGYVLQACEAIAEAHSLGIVHRDIKPSNLFVTRRVDGTPLLKVLDFGLAKTSVGGEEHVSLTRTRDIMGSPAYMSPEQLRATKDVDARTDVWSLGVCLFELLTRRVPFQGGATPEICAAVLKDAAPDVRSLRAELPEALAAAVARCLEKDRASRFADVAALAEALEPYADESMRGAGARVRTILTTPRPTQPAVGEDVALRTNPYGDTEVVFDAKPRRELTYSVAAGVAGLVVAAGIFIAAVAHVHSTSGSGAQAPASQAPDAPSPSSAAALSATAADPVASAASQPAIASTSIDAGLAPSPARSPVPARRPVVPRKPGSDSRDHM